ncbi:MULTISPECIES: DUF2975 domain-containing protein [Bizionia]|uniref:DUF2975 domain-containing protein n=1 Tax=Bizionia algoritergicola TaxID=291187 RepID=A0A5D0R0A9_9FLAO|nr:MULTISPECIES: DUF2975 domain-containing protein [Bizionia]OBX23531.1 hypothetical protein BAA08_04035 [Bizionia sp. APA-3]TYB74937.1 DUF2975 domain-containing protein [Bizionia algoritergicola]
MKKIKYLNVFVITLIIIYVIHFVGNLIIIFLTDYTEQFKDINFDFLFGNLTQYIIIGISIFTFLGLLFIKKGLTTIIKEGLFNLKSVSKFKTGGKLFLISGVLSFLFDFLIMYDSKSLNLLGNLGQDFLLMVIGFSLYIVADIISNGSLLQEDKNLTI